MKDVSPNSGGPFDIEVKRETIQEIESKIALPGFWDDVENSQGILRERAALEKIIQTWTSLNNQLEDARIMIELGQEAGDEATLCEVAEMNDRINKELEAAEFRLMLSAPHDHNSCFISINPGAGGTESQD